MFKPNHDYDLNTEKSINFKTIRPFFKVNQIITPTSL